MAHPHAHEVLWIGGIQEGFAWNVIPVIPSAVVRRSARNAVLAAELITKVVDLFHGGFKLGALMGARIAIGD